MSISIQDAMQLPQLKSLKLVTGSKGLDKKIEKIGILDHEIITGVIGDFREGDFVLTTFTPIRNEIIKIENCIKDLISCEISALAIKNIFVKQLSKNIIEYADKNNFPIFFFEENIYFEDIIEGLINSMHSRTHIELMASKIEILFKNDLKKPVIKELAYELNRNFYNEHIVIYCKEKRYRNEVNLINITERFERNRSRSIHHSLFKYKEGLLIILSYKKISTKGLNIDELQIFETLNIKEKSFYIGKSTKAFNLTELDKSIKESIYASKVCELLSEDMKNYNEIGIYKLLLPYANNKWLKSFTDNILNPIKEYDNGNLIETARIYIENSGDIIKVSEQMFQHKNTIRYRINKIKTLLNSISDKDFYEQLSIAIKCEKIIKNKE